MESYHETANGTNVDLWVEAGEPRERFLEPVTCSVPWPRGKLKEDSCLILRNERGEPVPLQTRILDLWPDNSIRWLLLDWQATVNGSARYRLEISKDHASLVAGRGIRLEQRDKLTIVDTGPAKFHLMADGHSPFLRVLLKDVKEPWAIEADCFEIVVTKVQPEELGLIRACVLVEGKSRLTDSLLFAARLHFFSGSGTVRNYFTFGNKKRAKHSGGFWELGEKSSILLDYVSFIIDFPSSRKPSRARCSLESGQPFEEYEDEIELFQASSAGPNWRSTTHLNRGYVVPLKFSGYRFRWGTIEQRQGNRATPIMAFERGSVPVALAMRYFWQNFPKAISWSEDGIGLGFFGIGEELQAGEQKTHEFVVAFGKDTVTSEPLAWVRSPVRVRAEPAWYCSTGAVPYLTPEADDANTDYVRLVRAAIEGEDTFEKKREVVDEYGWRHFGDIYADHEAVRHQGPQPLVSHYNNQYDPLAGFAYQFMRNGDWRWWSAMEELAAHVIDIDIYHTDQDKAAYDHGLFWHTVHYTDAGLSTHRSYPRAPGVPHGGLSKSGGGPGNEHNYTTGLMLHYFLTGYPQSRQAAIDLARWVIDMDDGTKTIFRWLDRGDTGLASATVSPLYHGPGRGAGNSIQALLDGHRLTGDPKFLAKAEQLIRRCIHPADDIAARKLLDAERRWSYTVFVQALGRYLDDKAERGELDRMYAYARAALLHYARWMAENEYPYLEKPEILEYPTETWAAQDMRKSEVFKFAAKHAAGAERERFLERAEFFFRYVTKTLGAMKTRTLARPVVILLSNGLMHAYFQKHPDLSAAPPPCQVEDFGLPEVFVSQKVRAKKRLLVLLAATACLAVLGLVYLFLS